MSSIQAILKLHRMSFITEISSAFTNLLSVDGPPGLTHPLLAENYDWVDKRLDELYYNYTNTTYEYPEDEHIKFNTPRSVTTNNDDDGANNEELCENQSNICETDYLTDVSELTEDDLDNCDSDDLFDYDSDDWYMYDACVY